MDVIENMVRSFFQLRPKNVRDLIARSDPNFLPDLFLLAQLIVEEQKDQERMNRREARRARRNHGSQDD